MTDKSETTIEAFARLRAAFLALLEAVGKRLFYTHLDGISVRRNRKGGVNW